MAFSGSLLKYGEESSQIYVGLFQIKLNYVFLQKFLRLTTVMSCGRTTTVWNVDGQNNENETFQTLKFYMTPTLDASMKRLTT